MIFEAAGARGESAQLLGTFGLGLVKLGATLATVLLLDRPWFGRRRPMLVGTAVITGCLALLSGLFFVDSVYALRWSSNLRHIQILI